MGRRKGLMEFIGKDSAGEMGELDSGNPFWNKKIGSIVACPFSPSKFFTYQDWKGLPQGKKINFDSLKLLPKLLLS